MKNKRMHNKIRAGQFKRPPNGTLSNTKSLFLDCELGCQYVSGRNKGGRLTVSFSLAGKPDQPKRVKKRPTQSSIALLRDYAHEEWTRQSLLTRLL